MGEAIIECVYAVTDARSEEVPCDYIVGDGDSLLRPVKTMSISRGKPQPMQRKSGTNSKDPNFNSYKTEGGQRGRLSVTEIFSLFGRNRKTRVQQ